MKIKYFISLAMAAALMVGCSNEDDFGTSASNGMLQATMEGNAPSARVGFDEDGAFYWSKGDRLGVTTSNSSTNFSVLDLVEGDAGKANGSFSGTISGTMGDYAVYPYNDNHSLSGTTLTYNFPAAYTYTAVDTDFFSPTKGEGNSFNPAMWGKITNENVSLRHLGGMVCIKFEKLPTGTDLKLTLTSDKKMNGTYTVDLNTSGTPQLEATDTNVDTERTVTITFSNQSDNTSGVFYIPVPTGTYSNVRLKVLDGNTEKANVACGTYTIERRDLRKLTVTNKTVSGGEEEVVSAVSQVADALQNKAAVSVSGQVSGTENTISLPAAPADTPVSISFQDVAENAKITFTDNASTGTSIKDLTISFPAGANPNLDLATPNSSITLTTNAGDGGCNEVTSATAENTLILDKGVTVNKLIVKAGNVRVKKGGKITAIERHSENSKVVKIYVEDGASIPSSLDASVFTVLSAKIADLEAVAKNGGTYTLNSDIVLTTPLVVEGTMTLDLNGHSIKSKKEGLTKVLNTSDALVLVRRGADLTINDSGGKGSIDYDESTGNYAAVKMTDTNDGAGDGVAKLTVNGGKLRGCTTGICGNGLRHGTEITIKGGTIMSAAEKGIGIYHPQDGTLTITGGKIVGESGLEMRSGTLTISGGTIEGTAMEFEKAANGNGATVFGSAVSVSQHATNKALKAVISGGTLKGLYALHEEDFQDDTVDGISMEVTGGTFTGGIYSENCTSFIKGGTFSDPGALGYFSDAANVTIKLAADTKLTKSMVIEKGTATIDLNNSTLTADASATVEISETNKNAVVAIAVKDGAKATVKNGKIGNDTDKLPYGVFAFGKAEVTLNDIVFGEMDIYAYNGKGKLVATGCTFKGWLSGWHHGATFNGCTFTIGKAYYPASICYGSTTFTDCKFFKNDVDADTYADKADDDGYYRCNYVVAQCDPSKSIGFTNCKFIDENNAETTSVATNDHPFHACGWGDGKTINYSITVDGAGVTSYCSDATKILNETSD